MGRILHVVVIGGSAAGLFTALLFARSGHNVLVVEQESFPLTEDVEVAARSAFRASAPHLVQPHAVMAKCRELLLTYLPDVYAQLLASGVCEAPLSTQMQASLSDTAARPGDERFTFLMSRRSTIDWVLRRAALAQARVTMCQGLRVAGLLLGRGKAPQHVAGIRTSEGNIPADLVIDATGYRSPIDRWLSEAGMHPTQTLRAECGLAYFGRQYRLRSGIKPPGPATTRVVVGLNEFTVGLWSGDNGSVQIALVPLARDHRFKVLRDPGVFTRVLGTIPFYAAWLDALDPISDVYPMGAVQNTLRRLVVDGSPVVTGLLSVGDSVCTTNPTLGRGLTFALQGSVDLLEAAERYGDDRQTQALAVDGMVCEHILPFYQDQVSIDRARLAFLQHTIFEGPAPLPVASERVTYAQLRVAALFDPVALRAFWKIMGMIAHPETVYTDAEVISRTHAVLGQHGSGPSMVQPTRKQLLDALAS
jgi:2-polyprenyl-6-methoxyphenol hydroxylase-like FAD-dependent oxidoreductase